MGQHPTFSLNIGWQALLVDLGVNGRHVLRKAGLPDDALARAGYALTSQEYFRFWSAIEEEAGAPLFALRIVEAISAESFDPPLFAALCSTDLLQAAQRLARYKRLLAPMTLDLEIDAAGALTLSPRWLSPQAEVPYSLQVAELAFFLKLARLATRQPIRAIQVCLTAPPPQSHARQYEKHFGTPVSVAAGPSISFAAVDVRRPFLTANEGMWKVFEPDLRRRLDELDTTATTGERVRAVLLELLPGSAATIERTAAKLRMSKRTLQRRLEDEGQSFRSLLNATREDLARHYLRTTHLSGGEIAFLLGFEDRNSFYRAFQEWTGQTPERARHPLQMN